MGNSRPRLGGAGGATGAAVRLWRHAASTGALAMSLVVLVVLMMYYFGTG